MASRKVLDVENKVLKGEVFDAEVLDVKDEVLNVDS